MGFVCCHKAKLPPWIDEPVGELRQVYLIAAKHERTFTRAFLRATRSMVDDESVRRDFVAALRRDSATVDDAISAFPFFDPADPERVRIWRAYTESLRRAYEKLVVESANEGNRREGLDVRVEIEKAEIPVVPVSPASLRWIEEQILRSVATINDQQRDAIRQIIFRNFERGGRPEDIFEEIRRLVGLTPNQADRVQRRVVTAQEKGLSEVEAQAVGSRFAEQLRLQRARTIARTTTIDAESQGLLEGWKQAQNAGVLGQGALKKWDAIDNSPKTTDICKDLDNHEPVPLSEPFFSNVLGAFVDRPPAHPNCRSTLVLVFPEA